MTKKPSAQPKQKRGKKSNNGNTKGILRHNSATGPGAHRIAVRRGKKAQEIADRRQQAWKLFVNDQWTMQRIADHLKVSNFTISTDIAAVDSYLRGGGDPDWLNKLRDRQQSALDGIRDTHWKKRAQRASADVLLGVLQREAKLQGLDRALKNERSYSYEQVDAIVLGIIRGLLSVFTAVEHRKSILKVVEQVGAQQFLPAPPQAKTGT